MQQRSKGAVIFYDHLNYDCFNEQFAVFSVLRNYTNTCMAYIFETSVQHWQDQPVYLGSGQQSMTVETLTCLVSMSFEHKI
jgi:hypothetical protein